MLQLAGKNLRLTVMLIAFAIVATAAVWQAQRIKVKAQGASPQAADPDDLRARLSQYRRRLAAVPSVPSGNTTDAVAAPSPSPNFNLGNQGDEYVPADYDGDGKTDAAVWKPQPSPSPSFFTIRQSTTSTNITVNMGLSTDDPSVVGDYDGDTKVDPAFYRAGPAAGNPSFWIYRPSTGGADVTITCSGAMGPMDCGQNGDFPAPGDYNNDGKFDFMVQRIHGGGCAADPTQGIPGNTPNADFRLTLNGAATHTLIPCVGTATDVILPGDYDGDGMTDITTTRGIGGAILWMIRKSSTLTFQTFTFGQSATDFPVQGDYNGDGKTDLAVWRPSIDPDGSVFLVHSIATNVEFSYFWGKNGDYPPGNFNSH